MINWRSIFYKKISLTPGSLDSKRQKAINESKTAREYAEKKIDSMIAQIDGRGDKWFLQPTTKDIEEN